MYVSAAHLGDEELLAVRDGECDDPALLAHVETCEYCRAVLDELRRFQAVVAGTAPPPGVFPSRVPLVEEELDFLHHPQQLPAEAAVPPAAKTAPPAAGALPAGWMAAARRRLGQVPERRSLGDLTLSMTEDGALDLQGGPEAVPLEEGLLYRLDRYDLHVLARQAGFASLLVVRLAGDWSPERAGDYDVTLVPEGGPVRVLPLLRDSLLARGMAWFPVPAGESELLVHLDATWRLHLRKVFPRRL